MSDAECEFFALGSVSILLICNFLTYVCLVFILLIYAYAYTYGIWVAVQIGAWWLRVVSGVGVGVGLFDS